MRKLRVRWFVILAMILGLVAAVLEVAPKGAIAGGGSIYRSLTVNFGQPTHRPVNLSSAYLTNLMLDSSVREVVHVHKVQDRFYGSVEMDITLPGRRQVPVWYPAYPYGVTYIHGFTISAENKRLADVSWNAWECFPGPSASLVQMGDMITTTVSLAYGSEQVLYAQPISTIVGTVQKLDAQSPSFSVPGSASGAVFLLTQPPVGGKFSSNDVCATVVWGPPQVEKAFYLPMVARGGR